MMWKDFLSFFSGIRTLNSVTFSAGGAAPESALLPLEDISSRVVDRVLRKDERDKNKHFFIVILHATYVTCDLIKFLNIFFRNNKPLNAANTNINFDTYHITGLVKQIYV